MSFYENRIREHVRNLIDYTPVDLNPRDVTVGDAVYSIKTTSQEDSLVISRVNANRNRKLIFLTTNGGKNWSGPGSNHEIIVIMTIAVKEVLTIREERRINQLKETAKQVINDQCLNHTVNGTAIDMNWLANGESDPFPDYVTRSRGDLCLAKMSDDILANHAFLYYDRSQDDELVAMFSGGIIPTKIAIMTGVKERLRWLSRRVAVLEGRYPGLNTDGSPKSPASPHTVVESFNENIGGLADLLKEESRSASPSLLTSVPRVYMKGDRGAIVPLQECSSFQPTPKETFTYTCIGSGGGFRHGEEPLVDAVTSPDKSVVKEIWALGSLTDDEFTELYGLVISGQEIPEKYKVLVQKLNEDDFHDENNERLNR